MNDGLSLSPEQVENEVEIARATSLLLDSKYLPGLNYERICSAIRDAAVSKGVMQGKLVDWSVFMELVSDERIIGSATRTNFLNLDRRIIVQAIRGEGTLRHPIHNIILLQMLIGRWSDVELAFKGESIEIEISRDDEKLGSQRVTRRRNMSYERREELIEKFRPMYLQLRADYPTLSHTQVLSMLPAMGQKAIRAKHANEESDNRRERHFANLDSEVVLHVCENLRGLRISGRVQKITVRVLLHGHRLLDTIGRVRPHLPKADALLNTLVGLRLAVEEVKE
ncbi:hypothetical protein [Paraburkholderia tropica]|uniref:hypothetical protein n=1 Tax=Paraburkholderia tropica TaxID=92647 RepID=UPI002AB1E4E3|nr:hypothetical protein [Paraburkholderia tropica]